MPDDRLPPTPFDPDPAKEIASFADSLLRLWARWLHNFADSSLPYLMRNFVDRPGRLVITPDEVQVELEPRPLDIVLEMAGYLEPLTRMSWLDGKTVVFHVVGERR